MKCGSPPGSPIPGTLQARTREWVTNFWWGKRKKTLEIKGRNCKGPVAGYVFGVSVAGVDELEEDSGGGGGPCRIATCWSLWRTGISPRVRWEPLGGGGDLSTFLQSRRCSPHAFCCWFQLPYFPGCLCEAPRKTSFLPTAQCGSPAQTCSDVVTVPSLSRV